MIRALAALLLLGAAPVPTAAPVLGIDHMPVAVSDLEAAQTRFRALGFTLKPGRFHANGIRNAHAKFADGSYIELITAPAARDPLTSRYRRLIAAGDGPAFLALLAPDSAALARALRPFGSRIEQTDGASEFRSGDPLDYLFFGGGGRSPTDRPEHFVHANGAEGIAAVWLAPRDPRATRRDLVALGARARKEQACLPGCAPATRLMFVRSAIMLLPAGRALPADRPIVGVTLRVADLTATAAALAAGGMPRDRIIWRRSSLIVPPALANGMWLEFQGPA